MPIIFLAMALAAEPAPQALPAKPMLICRQSESEVGSHIHPSRRCKTAEEWAVEDARRDGKPASMRVIEGQHVDTGAPSPPH